MTIPIIHPIKRGKPPTKYKSEYCQKLINYMAQGLSFESFAAEVSVGAKTLYNWLKIHEDFADAKDAATMLSLQFWEKKGLEALHDPKNFNTAIWIFSMKCRFAKLGWRDIPEVEQPKKEPDRAEVERQLEALKAMLRDTACQQPMSTSLPASSPPQSPLGLLGESSRPE